MAIIPGKAKFDMSNLGKIIDTSDPTLLNYIALYLTIKSERKNAPSLSMLQDKEASDKRMKELNEIYARGDKPPLAKKISSKKNSKPLVPVKREGKEVKVKITDKTTGKVFEFYSINQAARFLSITEGDKSRSGYEYTLKQKKEYKNYILYVKDHIYPNENNRGKNAPVVAENTLTGEKIEFRSKNACAEHLNKICECKVYKQKIDYIAPKSGMVDEWKVYFKEIGEINE